MNKTLCRLTVFFLLCSIFCSAAVERGVLLHEAALRITPDSGSQKIAVAPAGREVAIMEKSHDWIKIFAVVGEVSEEEQAKEITGWIENKGIVLASTPNGDRILFGAAVDAEDEASSPRGRRGAARDAMRLYARTAEYFPNSPLAAEALYRAGDIRWQIEYNDIRTLPSAKEQDPDVRPKIDEETMREVMKKFPRTKWADLAAYHLLDNKLCGDWQAKSSCPERETELYEKYAAEHAQSPKAAEALYKAAWRQAALIEIYKTEDQAARSGAAATRARNLAQRLVTQYPDSEWASRALVLQFKIEENIPTYGSDR